MLDIFRSLSVADYIRIFVEIALITYGLYKLFAAIAETRATQLIVIVLVATLVFVLSYIFELEVILQLYRIFLVPFSMMLVVFYHPELRRAFSSPASNRRFFRIGATTTGEQIDSILNACHVLTEQKRGALIVFPRHSDIKAVLDSGTKLNADLSSTLIQTIFDHDTPLHDGACVVLGNKITHAACYLPLSEQTGIKSTFGTRHRAALGLAEQSDAVVLIVSEETKAISLAFNANISYDLDIPTIKYLLLNLLSYKDVNVEDFQKENAQNG